MSREEKKKERQECKQYDRDRTCRDCDGGGGPAATNVKPQRVNADIEKLYSPFSDGKASERAYANILFMRPISRIAYPTQCQQHLLLIRR